MDTITLQEALAGFTANESAALGSYIGLSSAGVGQKQSIAALAKVAGGLRFLGKGSFTGGIEETGFARISSGDTTFWPTGYGLALSFVDLQGAQLILFLDFMGWATAAKPKLLYTSRTGKGVDIKEWNEL